ncbi:MAG TPA: signal peptidase I [Clostridia bacterium]|nr:signal peptidase I [Clostridia bacterium]
MELAPRARRNRQEYKRLRAYGWLWAVFAASLAVAFIFTALFTSIRATDAGMAPFVAENDIVLYSRLSRYVLAPKRGDVLAFYAEKNGPTYVGRAVGLPGETVEIRGGRVYIDGVLLDESAYASGACPDMAALSVPEGCYFVLPDARAYAGVEDAAKLTVSGNAIVGTAFLRVSPLHRIALFK